jgi:DNA invertase Pin-like site-specific DNA recombinase
MRVKYARVSTTDQDPELQLKAPRRISAKNSSSARDDGPELAHILEYVLREGDALVVWKLDQLA